MPTLELLIDASGMQRGATEAENALRRVKTAVDSVSSASSGGSSIYGGGSRVGGGSATSFSFGGGGGAASSAFQVGGGSVQIAQGIAQTTQALQGFNTQAAAFSAARTALELGNTIRDFQQFRGTVGGVTTVFGTLGAVIRANPIGAIATAIGLAATAMGLFGSKTQEASDKLTQFRERNREIGERVALGAADPRRTDEGLRDAVVNLRGRNASSLQSGEAAGILGVSEAELRGGLQDFGIRPNALLRDSVPRDQNGNPLPSGGSLFDAYARQAPPNFVERTFPTSDLAQFGEQLLRERQGRRDVAVGESEAAGFRAAEMEAEFQARNRAEEEARQGQQEAAKRIEESLQRAAQFGEQIGASVGDAAAQLLFAGSSLRSVVAGLVRQFATQGLQSAGAGIFGAITRGVAGATPTQTGANAGVPTGTGEMIPRG